MVSYAVIGASRGIGLEYVRQLAKEANSIVIAVVRNPGTSTHLNTAAAGLNNVHVVQGDVAEYRSLEAAAKAASELTGGKLDVLIHIAARTSRDTTFQGYDSFNTVEELDADLRDAFEINTLGVIHSISAFLPLLRASTAPLKKIAVLCTGAADPKLQLRIGISHMVAYAITQASALMATTKWALKLKDEGFVVISLSPGLVNTSDTTPVAGPPHPDVVKAAQAALKTGLLPGLESPETSVASQLKVISELTPAENGLFLKHTGGEMALP